MKSECVNNMKSEYEFVGLKKVVYSLKFTLLLCSCFSTSVHHLEYLLN